jgi:tetratricopeptide (TPR) repeat protein
MKTTLLCISLLACGLCGAEVTISEEQVIFPTYETESPDKMPLFYRPEEVQLAEKHVYPYPFYDVKSTEKVDKAYTAIILENEYLKICVTPQMGGRLYYAVDKTNGYDIVYNNRVVEPALIGTIGAWTSGGVEWNTPHHHRATSLIDVDYRLIENADGSKTVWVGEYEKRSQTRWLVGMTLEPGKAYVKMAIRSMNVTAYQYPALCFANAAVHVNDDYQFIFPPDVDMMNFHYVSEFTRWPVLNQVYQSMDYTHGEDLSWWKEAKQPVSFFVTKTSQDFMGGIDHGKNAGIVMIGDHRIFKGKKLWNWGKNEVQVAWDEKLTDEDGAYAELMMGFYSDNQPDYNFVAPFETKYGDMYLYGIKNLGGITEANKDFAANLEVTNHQAVVEVNATSVQKGVRVALAHKDKTLLEETVEISPASPYRKSVAVGEGMALEDLKLTVSPRGAAEPIAWQKQPLPNEPFPETYQDPRDPREYTTSQELFFAGLKVEQFGNTNYDYMKYYEAALTLNPNDVLTNTQLGLVYLKRKDYAKAEEHLRRAVETVTGNYKKAENATSLYYLGVCLMKQQKIDAALDLLYRATWAYEWTAAGYTLIARLEARTGNWDRALDAADRACKANTQNVEALVVNALVLRRLGEYEQALDTARQALLVDPLCFTAMNELRLLSAHISVGVSTEACRASLVTCLRAEPYNYIETASRYSRCGSFAEAAGVMGLAAGSNHEALKSHPMVHYHLGMYLALGGRSDEADAVLQKAAGLSTDLCFPYGDASVEALKFAISKNPRDANAHYLLGNALANYRHAKAVNCWKTAANHGKEEAIVYRNMAYIQANHLRHMPEALANIMKAVSLDPSEPRYFSEAHLYMSYASLTSRQLTEFLAHYGEMGKDVTDIQLMKIKLHIFNGEYDEAIRLLTAMQYHIKEGARFNPHVYWFDAHLQTGIRNMEKGDHAAAEQYCLKAMEFPANLEAERNGKIGISYYYLGLNAKRSSDPKRAKSYFEKMVDYTYSKGWGAGDFPELDYFKALASIELGKDRAEADKLFRKLIESAQGRLKTRKDSRHITVSVDESHSARTFLLEHELDRKNLRVSSNYMQGLGYLGLGNRDEARSFFAKAIEGEPLAVDAKLMLESIQ